MTKKTFTEAENLFSSIIDGIRTEVVKVRFLSTYVEEFDKYKENLNYLKKDLVRFILRYNFPQIFKTNQETLDNLIFSHTKNMPPLKVLLLGKTKIDDFDLTDIWCYLLRNLKIFGSYDIVDFLSRTREDVSRSLRKDMLKEIMIKSEEYQNYQKIIIDYHYICSYNLEENTKVEIIAKVPQKSENTSLEELVRSVKIVETNVYEGEHLIAKIIPKTKLYAKWIFELFKNIAKEYSEVRILEPCLGSLVYLIEDLVTSKYPHLLLLNLGIEHVLTTYDAFYKPIVDSKKLKVDEKSLQTIPIHNLEKVSVEQSYFQEYIRVFTIDFYFKDGHKLSQEIKICDKEFSLELPKRTRDYISTTTRKKVLKELQNKIANSLLFEINWKYIEGKNVLSGTIKNY